MGMVMGMGIAMLMVVLERVPRFKNSECFFLRPCMFSCAWIVKIINKNMWQVPDVCFLNDSQMDLSTHFAKAFSFATLRRDVVGFHE